MSKEAKPYSYFASTDGEDVFDKMIHLLKPAVVLGIGLSMVDTMCLTYPKGYLATLGRYIIIHITRFPKRELLSFLAKTRNIFKLLPQVSRSNNSCSHDHCYLCWCLQFVG